MRILKVRSQNLFYTTNNNPMVNLSKIVFSSNFWGFVVAISSVFVAFSGILTWWFSSKEMRAKDIQISSTAAQSDEAKKEAALALQKASEADKTSKILEVEGKNLQIEFEKQKTKTEKAHRDASLANARSAQLEAETNKLKIDADNAHEKAAKAQKALLELQTRLAPRSFSETQKSELIAKMSQYHGTHVAIAVLGEDEARKFGQQIAEILTSSRWEVSITLIGLTVPVYGVDFNYSAQNKAVDSLFKLFVSMGFHASNKNSNEFSIFVGLKRPP